MASGQSPSGSLLPNRRAQEWQKVASGHPLTWRPEQNPGFAGQGGAGADGRPGGAAAGPQSSSNDCNICALQLLIARRRELMTCVGDGAVAL